MNANKYLAARMRHTMTGRDPIVMDILAAGVASGPNGYSVDDIVRTCGHTPQEVRMTLSEMKQRGEVQLIDEKWMQTISGRKTAEKIFYLTVNERHFDTAVFWIKKLLDSDDPKEFREANSWVVSVMKEREKER